MRTRGGAEFRPDPVPGVENAIWLNDRILSGGQPEGGAAFAAFAERGITTLLSVDGARPNIDAAHQHGLRYVHVPIGYDGITDDQMLQIAKTLHTSPGKVFVHCHHGKHRGPTAAALGALVLGELDHRTAAAFQQRAGTSESYAGLYRCVALAGPIAREQLLSPAIELPEVAEVSGLIESMVVVDHAFEHLGLIEQAGWHTPADHPDLVPAAEAGRLAEALRGLLDDPSTRDYPEDYRELMQRSAAAARDLERELSDGAARAVLTTAYVRLKTSCKDCHVVYRN